MAETQLFNFIMIGFTVLGAIIFIALFFITAPFGRFTTKRWGLSVKNRAGWFMMEAPASILMAAYFLGSPHRGELVPFIFLLIWQTHYFHRGFIYPLTLRDNKSMPILIAVFGLVFNVLNTYVQGRWLFYFAPDGYYPASWLVDPRFIAGVVLFFGGYVINKWADAVLRSLRRNKTDGYSVPQGGLYKYISCPNYFGEIMEWVGWACLTWSFAGAVFAFWTIANLAPRAFSIHGWYKNQFPDYPEERKALIPFIC